MEQMEQVNCLYPLYLREENKELKLNGHTILREGKMIICILFWNDVQSALCIWGFRICRFKHLRIENIGENCYIINVLGSVLNIYGLFFLSLFLKQYNTTTIYIVFTLYKVLEAI